ncbi:MAG: Uncharacterized protein G01um10145_461 [Microgenomates group bacterium Gr01-1014_5]|nr:MAG: Uncharacterized protein G01um10145_461 [Microgenomates group bacterium Gr01-1014_5]
MVAPLTEKRLQALELRKQGFSYSYIKEQLQVSKSSLSLWLRGYPLSREQINKLRANSEKRIERFRETWRIKTTTRRKAVYDHQKKLLLPLTKRELLIAGLFLYWGEGAKTTPFATSLSNTNPKVVKFFLYWLIKILKVPKDKITIRLHLYKDMDQKMEIAFWSKELRIPEGKFIKPYIKETTLRGLTYKGIGHGTCNLIVNGRDLIEKILMSIEVVSDEYVRRLRT